MKLMTLMKLDEQLMKLMKFDEKLMTAIDEVDEVDATDETENWMERIKQIKLIKLIKLKLIINLRASLSCFSSCWVLGVYGFRDLGLQSIYGFTFFRI